MTKLNVPDILTQNMLTNLREVLAKNAKSNVSQLKRLVLVSAL